MGEQVEQHVVKRLLVQEYRSLLLEVLLLLPAFSRLNELQ